MRVGAVVQAGRTVEPAHLLVRLQPRRELHIDAIVLFSVREQRHEGRAQPCLLFKTGDDLSRKKSEGRSPSAMKLAVMMPGGGENNQNANV